MNRTSATFAMRTPLSIGLCVGFAALSGGLYFAAFPGVGCWPLAVVALVPLLVAIQDQQPRRALWLGLLSGSVTAFVGFWWLLGMLTRYSGFSTPLCVLFLALLSTYQGGRTALACWMYARAERNGWPRALVFTTAWAAAETVYPLLFPWFLGCALQPAPVLVQAADLGGPILLSASLAFINATVAHLFLALLARRRPSIPLCLSCAALVVALLGYGVVRMHQMNRTVAEAPGLSIGLVQGNIPMDIQGKSAYKQAFNRQLEASRALVAQGAELVVWSESAFLYQVPEADARRFVHESLSRHLGTAVLVGAVVYREHPPPSQVFNSALLLDRGGELVARYDKHHLLAFGEYIPFGELFPILYQWSPESGHFTPGKGFERLILDGKRLAVLICYEDILPRFVNTAVKQTEADLLIDITNDAWFGETAEPRLHLALSQLRAVEHRRYLARAANTGVSAIIDPAGRVVAQTEMFVSSSLLGRVRWLNGKTLYRVWGDWPWAIVSAFALLMSVRRRNTPKAEVLSNRSPSE